MNNVTENIDWLMNAIRAEEIAKLNMSHTVAETSCGTAACIYGFAALKEHGPDVAHQLGRILPMYDDFWDDYFGVENRVAMELFFAYSLDDHFQGDCLPYLTKDDALIALQAVREGKFETWLDTLPKDRLIEIEERVQEELGDLI